MKVSLNKAALFHAAAGAVCATALLGLSLFAKPALAFDPMNGGGTVDLTPVNPTPNMLGSSAGAIPTANPDDVYNHEQLGLRLMQNGMHLYGATMTGQQDQPRQPMHPVAPNGLPPMKPMQ